ncbi:OTU domain-containing protein 2 [Fulvia fulva]|uniref:OTU domain-containing protein 2 n=1 Tax=Passalora fulva TaxID=5499 RepID=A0A9Q8LEA5_PASFU|nr:OTU domain-containing protein 2 [Fulvia fulva]KAK4626279.1 OTU domain-containing protein 2 [Fulvia fulva]KAK4628136.1 OTU domain-containing protein 2 [Fulvia fulva]UJO15799.1 OTU domain-containing protein 2 [Fulvia fulva]WPV13936.1 OTU domain-containing protein 2 [Fulvia fulva]WPV28709.1 OTU domain-containing protein 2 [Fulvia fulva]
MEELQARHRKEQRDLQSRITQKKKQASKKTRKGVNDECDRLDAELREKQAQEVAALEGGEVDGEALPIEQMDDRTLKVDEEVEENGTEDVPAATEEAEQNGSTQPGKKRNRQKDRLARRAAEQEEAARQADEEAQNMPDLKEQERSRMLEAMKSHKLHEKEIRADGHCLYSAVADQLEQLDIPLGAAPDDWPALAYKTVRAKAADYISQHQDDFVPFLEEPLPEYLHKVRDTGEWGGQLELMALAKTYGIDINVLQDFGRVEKIQSGSETTGKAMWLGYYKHGFGLGEHYNSLRKVP